jgi:hypothetical protein
MTAPTDTSQPLTDPKMSSGTSDGANFLETIGISDQNAFRVYRNG